VPDPGELFDEVTHRDMRAGDGSYDDSTTVERSMRMKSSVSSFSMMAIRKSVAHTPPTWSISGVATMRAALGRTSVTNPLGRDNDQLWNSRAYDPRFQNRFRSSTPCARR
jgi:hypothetical protein